MRKLQKTSKLFIAPITLILLTVSPFALSHCEIPCGIYDDTMRLNHIAEHIRTIEKSMNQINFLTEQKDKNYNQIVRWITNKENHADMLTEIVTQYFLTQRIKLPESTGTDQHDQYLSKLEMLHKLMVYSMKCKQTTDLQYIEKLRETLKDFRTAYMGKAEMEHSHSHSEDHGHSHN